MVILIILLKAYKKTQKGAKKIVDFITNIAIPMWIISYVDDNSIVRHFSATASVKDMLEGMKTNLLEWQKLLQLTGGDLSLGKCQIIIMNWYQDREWGILKMRKKQQQNDTIIIKSIKKNAQTETI